MKSFLKNLLPSSNSHTKFIKQDLEHLNQTQAGLGDSAVSYVLTGENETVLSTLSTVGGGDQLNVCGAHRYNRGNSALQDQRPYHFIDMDPFDGDLLVRYAKVLTAAHGGAPDHALGSKTIPDVMRVLFTETALGAVSPTRRWDNEPREAQPKGLTRDQLIPMAHACGGTTAQLFELLYWENDDYVSVHARAFRELLDPSTLVKSHPEDAIKGITKSPAKGRTIFVNSLHKWKLTQQEPFLGCVLSRVGDSSRAVREAAVNALRDVPANIIEPIAIEQLSKGAVGVRTGMVEVLLGLGTDTATQALRAHAKTEKTARIVAMIENAFSAAEMTSESGQAADDATGYTAIDGTRIDIPAPRSLTDGPGITITNDDRKLLKTALVAANEKIKARNADNKAKNFRYQQQLLKSELVGQAETFLTTAKLPSSRSHDLLSFLNRNAEEWLKEKMAGLAQKPALTLAIGSLYNARFMLSQHQSGAITSATNSYLATDTADLRALDDLWQELQVEVKIGDWNKSVTRKAIKGDLLRMMIPAEMYAAPSPHDLPVDAVWPYLADNFDVLDEALGVRASEFGGLGHVIAIGYLARMPKTPMRYFAPLLEIATGERKAGKAEARALLNDVPQVTDRLITLLTDSRQAIRKGAAEWLAAREDTAAIPALKTQLKKEKSEIAKAAILTALKQLGEPLDSYVGPTVLIREAEAGLKKAKFDKLDWLNLDHMPAAKFKNGKPVPVDVLRWWIFLAFKLKQPGGNALFEIYLDQLKPDSATAFSKWVFDNWIAYDTLVPSDEEANAYAEKNADVQVKMYQRWNPNFTRAQAFAQLRNAIKSQYQNTGTATKGILGLTSRVPSQVAADQVRAYLRNHGSRTSQASSLLEVLANKGDPVSLQVVIAAATRLKQKGVQKFAGDLVQAVADKMNWSLNELGDRTIPTAGLDDDGNLDLHCGEDEKLYRATLGDDLTFVLKNPDGKIVKALSSGKDEATKASKKQLTASKKELKQVIAMQTARLYEALCGERVWPLTDWTRDFHDHPVMRRLIERVVWQGLDANNAVLQNFRPTAEGEFTDAEDNEVDISAFAGIRLAHGATLSESEADQWAAHLKDYEIKPLFAQFGRSLLRLPDDQKDKTEINDRKGWVTESFAIRGAASKLGYERCETQDGGWFYGYQKSFKGVGLTAIIEFTGNFLPEENRNVAIISLGFEKEGGRYGKKVKLSEVPPVLLSECWNDLHAMAAKGAHDPDWEKNTQW